MKQPELDFDMVLHTRENNAASEMILAANRPRLIKSCMYVLSLLLRGEELQVLSGAKKFNITSLPRRIKDIEVWYEKVTGTPFEIPEISYKGGMKGWFLDERSKCIIESVLNDKE